MTYHGHIENGVVVLEGGADLPEGLAVEVRAASVSVESEEEGVRPLSFHDRYRSFIGMGDDLPTDMAENHDHYLHGAPKREQDE